MLSNSNEFGRELEKVNPWWLSGQVKEAQKYPFQRDLIGGAVRELSSRRIILLLGGRRTGKSVLLKQMIASLIKNGVNPSAILYYSLDDPSLSVFSDNLIKDLIDYHEENIAPEGKRYIFFDEAHAFPEWFKWTKAFYDRDLPVKFILSGSSSLTLQEEANKYLRGRSIEFSLYPLNLNEFLALSGLDRVKLSFDDLFKQAPLEVSRLGSRIKKGFHEFLLVGGLPEWFQVKNLGVENWFQRIIGDVVKKAIYEDIAKLFGIKSPRFLELIYTFIISNQSRILSYEAINEIAGLDRVTLVNYIEFLKNSYLLIEILKYAKLKEQLKAKKKFLAVDQGIRNALLKDYQMKEGNLGFVIENIIGIKCFLEKESNVFYWKNNGEVDFILKNKAATPIEVKYRSRIQNSDLNSLISFTEKSKLQRGIVITKDIYQKREINQKEIWFIPAWLFLLAE